MAKRRSNHPDENRKQRRAASAEPVDVPKRRSSWKAIAIVVIGGVAIGGAVVIETQRAKPAAVVPMPRAPVNQPMTPPGGGTAQRTPQPAGEVPPGKVWSAEHGHWHDAATGQGPQ